MSSLLSRKCPPKSNGVAGNVSVDGVTPECPICLERMSLPKVFHCGHTICKGCVSRIGKRVETGGFSNPVGFTITCPICKQLTRSTGMELATNYALRGGEFLL